MTSITAEELGHVELISTAINLMLEGSVPEGEPAETPLADAKTFLRLRRWTPRSLLEGQVLPYRVFNKDQRASHTASVENKRLGHALAIIKAQQNLKYSPKVKTLSETTGYEKRNGKSRAVEMAASWKAGDRWNCPTLPTVLGNHRYVNTFPPHDCYGHF